MSGFAIEGGEIVITNGARTVQTTDGKMVNLLPAAYDYTATINVTFPDFTGKTWAYNWWFTVQGPVGGNYGLDNGCRTALVIPPQNFNNVTNLTAAPPGADFFVARVRLNRTVSPTHSWGGSAITTLPVTNQWIPFSGSILMEAELGMSRAMSIYLSGGNLVLHRQQSVGPPAGGYGTYGSSPNFPPGAKTGGEWLSGSAQGIPIQTINVRDSPTVTDSNSSAVQNNRMGNTDACSVSLPSTNFTSTYSVEIVGSFGRRS